MYLALICVRFKLQTLWSWVFFPVFSSFRLHVKKFLVITEGFCIFR